MSEPAHQEITDMNPVRINFEVLRPRAINERLVRDRNVLDRVYALYVRARDDENSDVKGAGMSFIDQLARDNFGLAYRLASDNLHSSDTSLRSRALNNLDILLSADAEETLNFLLKPKNKVHLSLTQTRHLSDGQVRLIDPEILFISLTNPDTLDLYGWDFRRVFRIWAENDPIRAREWIGKLEVSTELGKEDKAMEMSVDLSIIQGNYQEAEEKVFSKVENKITKASYISEANYVLGKTMGRISQVDSVGVSTFIVQILKDTQFEEDLVDILADCAFYLLKTNSPLAKELLTKILEEKDGTYLHPHGAGIVYQKIGYLLNDNENEKRSDYDVNLEGNYKDLITVLWDSYQKNPTQDKEGRLAILLPGIAQTQKEMAYSLYLHLWENGVDAYTKVLLTKGAFPHFVREHPIELSRLKDLIESEELSMAIVRENGKMFYIFDIYGDRVPAYVGTAYQVRANALNTTLQFAKEQPEYCRKLIQEIVLGRFKEYQADVLSQLPRLVEVYPKEVCAIFTELIYNSSQARKNNAVSWLSRCFGKGIDEYIINLVDKFKGGLIGAENFYLLIGELFQYDHEAGLSLAEYMFTIENWKFRESAAYMIGVIAQQCNFRNYEPPVETSV